MTARQDGAPRGTRWIPVECGECGVTHGVTAGAAIVAIKAGQEGDTVTTGGTPKCFLPSIVSARQKGTGKAGSRTVDYVYKVGE